LDGTEILLQTVWHSLSMASLVTMWVYLCSSCEAWELEFENSWHQKRYFIKRLVLRLKICHIEQYILYCFMCDVFWTCWNDVMKITSSLVIFLMCFWYRYGMHRFTPATVLICCAQEHLKWRKTCVLMFLWCMSQDSSIFKVTSCWLNYLNFIPGFMSRLALGPI
jgi:hypothetical protein